MKPEEMIAPVIKRANELVVEANAACRGHLPSGGDLRLLAEWSARHIAELELALAEVKAKADALAGLEAERGKQAAARLEAETDPIS